MIVLQSSATALRPCPLGTFENSQQHARVIYCWVYGRQPTPSPKGTTEALLVFFGQKNRFTGRDPALIGMTARKRAAQYGAFGICVNSRNSRKEFRDKNPKIAKRAQF
jgi:hypothetical protein